MKASAPTLEPYIPGESTLHRLDPRARLLILLSFLVALTWRGGAQWPRLTWMSAWLGVGLALGHLPLVSVLKRAMPALVSVPFVAFGSALQVGPEISWGLQIWNLSIGTSPEALLGAMEVSLRAILAALAIGLYACVAPFSDTIWAMQAVGVPEVLVSTVALLYRYLFLLVQEAWRMERAREARTLRPASLKTLNQEARLLGSMVGCLFLRAYGRSERVYWAMLSRGFSGRFHMLREVRWSHSDTAASSIGLGVVAFSFLLPHLLLLR